jgi:hypothetical protein
MYKCPMHPEVISDKPGKCPKCGMNLVLAGEIKPTTVTWKSYIPLLVIISMITIVSAITSFGGNVFVLNNFILYFMIGFFLTFGTFKLLDLKGFAEGYSTYDLLAKKWYGYGYIYPFIEIAFGILMLSGYHPVWLLWTEFAVMVFSGIGVGIKMAKKEELMCACLGTFLKIPLTKVTSIEDFGMAILILITIFSSVI